MAKLSPTFVQAIRDLHGRAGEAWLAILPARLERLANRWALTLGPPFANLSYNYVAPALANRGTEAVIKLGVPRPELQSEISALRVYDGQGAVRLLDADFEEGALLLERLNPGQPLLHMTDDDQATVVAAELMKELWRPVPAEHSFPSVFDWARGFRRLRSRFEGQTGPLPEALVARAEATFAEFKQSKAETVLLHGDLHHGNIVSARRQPWLALDPKGVVGERAYEPGALLRNPMPEMLSWSDLPRITARRVDLLAERLDLDHRRIAAWGMAQAVLSAVWDLEDNGAVDQDWLACAEICLSLVD